MYASNYSNRAPVCNSQNKKTVDKAMALTWGSICLSSYAYGFLWDIIIISILKLFFQFLVISTGILKPLTQADNSAEAAKACFCICLLP